MSVDDTNYYMHYENYQLSLFCAMFTGVRGSFGNLVGLCCPRVATPTILWGRPWMLELPAMLLVARAVSHHRLLMTGACIVADLSGQCRSLGCLACNTVTVEDKSLTAVARDLTVIIRTAISRATVGPSCGML